MASGADKERVALGSVAASGFLTLAKLVVGLLTGSIGILSEAAHSFLDLGATILTYVAVRLGDKPADADHPYGHGKVESVAALAETALLFLTSAWIVYEAAGRLLAARVEVEATWYAVLVILASIAVDWFRARALSRVATATKSQALEADALHFSSDILSSGVVLIGLGFVWAGFVRADAIAAIGVACFVCIAGYRLGRRTIDILIDTAPEGMAEDLAATIRAVPGIVEVARLRLRPAGKTVFVEAQVRIPRTLSVERAHGVAEAAAARVREKLPDADVVVRPEPVPLDSESIADRVRVIARRHGMPVHHLTVQQLGDRTSIALDLEVDGRQTLERAHATASALEALVRDELGPDLEVETHIEPLQAGAVRGNDLPEAERRALAETVAAAAREVPMLLDTHAVRARRTRDGLHVAVHCTADGGATVEAVHEAVSQLEALLRQRLPGLRRVVTHAEPAGRTPRAASDRASAV